MSNVLPQCWWCGRPADSREHRSKRTDLVNLFGGGPWHGSVVRGVDGQLRTPQSARSQEFKFTATLCADCNNNRSQPFDRAYETFVAYYDGNESRIAQSGILDLAVIFGVAWQEQQAALSRYLVKHIGCRLADSGTPVPESFVAYLDGSSAWPTELSIMMVFRSDMWELNNHSEDLHQEGARGIFIGAMEGMVSRSTGSVSELDSHYVYASLGMHWRLDADGSGEINFQGPVVELPEFHVVPPDEIALRCEVCNPK